MKKILLVAVVMAIVAMAGVVMAADTNTLTVNATVVGTCKFNAATSTLNLSLDPSSAVDATASTTVTYWCTNGTTAAGVASNDGIHSVAVGQKRLSDGTNFIPYSIALTGGTQAGGGPASPKTLTINGTVLNAAFINAVAGTYADTVMLSLNP